MRYHIEQPEISSRQYGKIYECDHPVYSRCTLFKIRERGLAVIQQYYDAETKCTRWDAIFPWLNDIIYLQPGFWPFFDKRSDEADEDGLYPTVTVRQIMWALKMKPLPKQRWEKVFDRKEI
mgnify:CR=1 FL=1